jgi:fumarate reductase subunit C
VTVYRRPVAMFWWLRRRSYLVFVLRELSSVFVAWFVVYLLLLVTAISAGSQRYQQFLAWSGTWWVLGLNLVALAFVLLHTVTWFGLAPRAIVIRWVPPWVILGLHYLAWAAASALIGWVILR